MTKTDEQMAEDAVENCGEYSNMCKKWYLKGLKAGRECDCSCDETGRSIVRCHLHRVVDERDSLRAERDFYKSWAEEINDFLGVHKICDEYGAAKKARGYE